MPHTYESNAVHTVVTLVNLLQLLFCSVSHHGSNSSLPNQICLNLESLDVFVTLISEFIPLTNLSQEPKSVFSLGTLLPLRVIYALIFNLKLFTLPDMSGLIRPDSFFPSCLQLSIILLFTLRLSTSLGLSNLLFLYSTNQSSILGPYTPISQYQFSPPVSHSPPPPFSSINVPQSSTLPVSTQSSSLVLSQTTIPSLPTPTLPEVSSTVNSMPPSFPITNHHPMQTMSKSGITKPKSKFCYKFVMDYTYTEPPTYKIASQYPKWCEPMDAEFQALQRQNTWSLVFAPPHANLVGCKWVFKLKLNSDGSIARYKARLVA